MRRLFEPVHSLDPARLSEGGGGDPSGFVVRSASIQFFNYSERCLRPQPTKKNRPRVGWGQDSIPKPLAVVAFPISPLSLWRRRHIQNVGYLAGFSYSFIISLFPPLFLPCRFNFLQSHTYDQGTKEQGIVLQSSPPKCLPFLQHLYPPVPSSPVCPPFLNF